MSPDSDGRPRPRRPTTSVDGARPRPRGGWRGRDGAGDEGGEPGLRGLIGSGRSRVSTDTAMRARDVAQPTEADLAAAAASLVIRRRPGPPPERFATELDETPGRGRLPRPGRGRERADPDRSA
jgi:hypothetical protein